MEPLYKLLSIIVKTLYNCKLELFTCNIGNTIVSAS